MDETCRSRSHYRALLGDYRALLSDYRALLSDYRALLREHRDLLSECVCDTHVWMSHTHVSRVHVCDTDVCRRTHTHVRHGCWDDEWVTCLIHIFDLTYTALLSDYRALLSDYVCGTHLETGYAWHDIHVCDMSHSYVRYNLQGSFERL